MKAIVENALRTLLADMLAECTEPQRALFFRLYPDGVAGVPQDRLDSAIGLCDRTIKSNKAHRVACVNACEGLNPEAVQELLEACKAAVPILARACVCSRLETPLGEAQCPPCLAAGILRAAIAKATRGE